MYFWEENVYFTEYTFTVTDYTLKYGDQFWDTNLTLDKNNDASVFLN